MVDGDFFLISLLVVYCAASIFMFTERLIYFIRCTYDSNFRKKQPALETSNYTRYDFNNHIYMVAGTCY